VGGGTTGWAEPSWCVLLDGDVCAVFVQPGVTVVAVKANMIFVDGTGANSAGCGFGGGILGARVWVNVTS
jgi:hypothetical protein